MKIKTSELTGAALDWAVAKCEGLAVFKSGAGPSAKMVYIPKGKRNYYKYEPAVNWKQGGPIIERERIDVISDPNGTAGWLGRNYINQKIIAQYGATPLIAAMRCYVASKLGDEVEIPEELK